MTWLWRQDDYIRDWTPLRAEQAAELTERMLLGHAGPARVEPTAAQRARKRQREQQQAERPRLRKVG